MSRTRKGLLASFETEILGPASIRRARMAGGLLWFLVRCRCGRRFAHRADRQLIACYSCGIVAVLLIVRRRPPLERVVRPRSRPTRALVRAPNVYAFPRRARPA